MEISRLSHSLNVSIFCYQLCQLPRYHIVFLFTVILLQEYLSPHIHTGIICLYYISAVPHSLGLFLLTTAALLHNYSWFLAVGGNVMCVALSSDEEKVLKMFS